MDPLLADYNVIIWASLIGLALGASFGALAVALFIGAKDSNQNDPYEGDI